MGSVLELCPATYDHPDAALLVAAVQREYVLRYGGRDATPVDPVEFVPPNGLFVVGYAVGEPVACGGWRSRDPGRSRDRDPVCVVGGAAAPPPAEVDALRDGDAEVKRMFVRAGHRGRGHARAVLAELERSAAAAGRRRTVLETGTRQPEAIALYTSSGYVRMTAFGVYRDSPNCRCFAKALPPSG